MRLALPGLALAEQLYLAVQAQGLGQQGTHALQLALAQLSGLDWPGRRAEAQRRSKPTQPSVRGAPSH